MIIDIMQLFLNVKDLNEYGEVVSKLRALKAVADKRQVSILMIHHTNKVNGESRDFMERSLGSVGVTATCDTTIFMTRPRNERRADMHITGRSVLDKCYTLKMEDNCGWVLEGDKREVVEGDTQRLVADWIRENGGATPNDIFRGLKDEGYTGTSDTVRQTCHRMKKAGKLNNDIGAVYTLFTPPVTVSQPNQESAKCDSVTPVTPILQEGIPANSRIIPFSQGEELEIY